MTPYDVAFYVPTIAPLLAGDRSRPPGGAETQVRLISRALVADGLRVAVVAFDHDGLPDEDHGVTVVRRPPHRGNPAAEAREIALALRRAPARVVVTRQAGAHTGLAAMVARAGRRRFVYSAANVIDFDFGNHERHPLKRALFATGLRLADEIVAQTDEQGELCQRVLGRSAPVIRSIAETAPQRRRRPEAFLWAGRVLDYKQPLAYLELARALPEARFWMVAVPDQSGPQVLEELRRQAPGLSNLELLPPCTRNELLDRMERSVAVVSTSTTEGMPNIWLEGWARGVPALTLSHDPDGLVASRRLGAAAQGDPARFAEAARQAWQARDDQAEVAARCRDYVVTEHSAAAVARKWRMVLCP